MSANTPAPIELWKKHLEDLPKGIGHPDTVEMDDGPQLAPGLADPFPHLKTALEFFQEQIFPVWEKIDREAVRYRKLHKKIAFVAIAGGGLAILLGMIQLFCAKWASDALRDGLAWVELFSALSALTAVASGFLMKAHHRWLARRQAAERLRSLKFEALVDPNLWCNPVAWRESLITQIQKLAGLEFKNAEEWIKSGPAYPQVPVQPPCVVTREEVEAVTAFYQWKRQARQQLFFQQSAARHKHDIWLLRIHVPVFLFVLSVCFVVGHAIIDFSRPEKSAPGTPGTNEFSWALFCVLLAAFLPVVGFCIRAWFSAFELPRRASLFESKANQLATAIDFVQRDQSDLGKTFYHIVQGEHFFLTEHREWCRLISEAEWFL